MGYITWLSWFIIIVGLLIFILLMVTPTVKAYHDPYLNKKHRVNQDYTTTIVSGVINLKLIENRQGLKSVKKYLTLLEDAAETGVPMILFLDQWSKNELEEETLLRENVMIVDTDFKKLQYPLSTISPFQLPNQRQPNKDTHTFFSVMYQKLEWIKKAAEMNPFGTEQFCWMDAGLNIVTDHEKPIYQQKIQSVAKLKVQEKIICCSNSDRPPKDWSIDVDHFITNFIGGIFIVPKELANWFSFRQKEVIEKWQKEKNRSTWESTVFAQIAHDHPEQFHALLKCEFQSLLDDIINRA